MIDIEIRKALQVPYPECEFCHGRLSLPCRLAFKDDNGNLKHFITCVGCYKIAITLQKFFEAGYLYDSKRYKKGEY